MTESQSEALDVVFDSDEHVRDEELLFDDAIDSGLTGSLASSLKSSRSVKYLRGWPLCEVIMVRGPLPVPDAVDYLVQACEALAESHMLGFAHRNLTMSTLLLTRRPDRSASIKLLDFSASDGLLAGPYGDEVSLVNATAFLESLPYTSPEQIRNANDVDARADVWALGTILHELLAGSPLFCGDTGPALVAMIVADPAPRISALRPEVALELEAVILRCVEKDRNARFSNVAELAHALEPFVSDNRLRLLERISRMRDPNMRPPPLDGPARKLTPLPPLGRPRALPVLRREPRALLTDRLPLIALAVLGIIAGTALGTFVAFRSGGEIRPSSAALTSRALAATPAAVKRMTTTDGEQPSGAVTESEASVTKSRSAQPKRVTRPATAEPRAAPEPSPRREDPLHDEQKVPEAASVAPKNETSKDLFDDVR